MDEKSQVPMSLGLADNIRIACAQHP